MGTMLTSKGQVTIPKRVRDALGLVAGNEVDFVFNEAGEVVVRKADASAAPPRDRFEAARGIATIKWRTDDLMKLLRD